MKIALFHNLPPGGAKRALYEHARLLRERGHTLDAYIMSTATEEYLPLAPLCREVFVRDVPAEATGENPLLRLTGGSAGKMAREAVRVQRRIAQLDALEATYAALADEIDARGYDLVYVHHCRLLLSPYLLQRLRTPSVYFCQDTLRHIHEWATEDTPGYDAIPEKLGLSKTRGHRVSLPTLRLWHVEDKRNVANLRAATLTLANSYYSREAILRTCGVNARVCDLGVDSDFFHPDPKIKRERVVLSVGSLAPLKRHDFILDAIATIPKSRRPAMQIIGYDPVRYGQVALSPQAQALVDRAATLDVELRLCKEVTDEGVRDGYRRAGVVAFAPYLEPFGFVTLEAMACGAPVVGIREAGLRETIDDGVTGLLADRDVDEFGATLDRVLTDSAVAAGLGAAGRHHVCRRWTWERSADLLEALFARALGRNSIESPAVGITPDREPEASCASR